MNTHLSAMKITADTVEAAATIGWIARSKALRLNAAELAAMGAPQRVIEARKALTTSVTQGAGGAPVLAFAEGASSVSAFMRMVSDGSFQRAPVDQRLIFANGDATGSLVEEGAAIPVIDLDLEGTVLKPQKAASMTVATREAWADLSGPGQAFIVNLLRKAVGTAADTAMIAGFGTIPAVAAAADDIAAIRTAMQAAIGVLMREAGQRFVWLLSPQAVKALAPVAPGDRVTVDLSGTGTIFGAPVAVTNALPAGDMLLVSASDVAAALIDLQIAASDESSIEFMIPPVGNSATPTATTTVSMFETNSVAVRMTLDFALAPLRDTVAARVTLTEAV